MKKYIFSDKMLPNQANHKKLHLYFFCHNPAMAYANGITTEAKPKNKVGGCITIQ